MIAHTGEWWGLAPLEAGTASTVRTWGAGSRSQTGPGNHGMPCEWVRGEGNIYIYKILVFVHNFYQICYNGLDINRFPAPDRITEVPKSSFYFYFLTFTQQKHNSLLHG